ncbi:MAG: transcriptional regulator [Alphaproteobacteria bacterium PA3]|nr:MAG: transcriptional regulator [Alphaproteobacteria bacterium PA3]
MRDKIQKVLIYMARVYQPKRPALDPCPIEAVVSMIGGKWKARILFILSKESLAFASLCRTLGGISSEVLSTQLSGMERDGLVTRNQATTTERHSGRYTLTEKGAQLVAVLLPVSDWASKQLEEQGFYWSPPFVQSG